METVGQDLEQLKQQFIERTQHHIELVNKYAQRLGLQYPQHDSSKLTLLLDGYCYFCKPKELRTEQENEVLDTVTLIHIKNSPHHPEYWTDTDLTGWTRSNFTPSGPIDCSQMPEECIVEMVCDWHATGEEKGNTCLDWYNKVNGVRWVFTPEQQQLISQLIEELQND